MSDDRRRKRSGRPSGRPPGTNRINGMGGILRDNEAGYRRSRGLPDLRDHEPEDEVDNFGGRGYVLGDSYGSGSHGRHHRGSRRDYDRDSDRGYSRDYGRGSGRSSDSSSRHRSGGDFGSMVPPIFGSMDSFFDGMDSMFREMLIGDDDSDDGHFTHRRVERTPGGGTRVTQTSSWEYPSRSSRPSSFRPCPYDEPRSRSSRSSPRPSSYRRSFDDRELEREFFDRLLPRQTDGYLRDLRRRLLDGERLSLTRWELDHLDPDRELPGRDDEDDDEDDDYYDSD